MADEPAEQALLDSSPDEGEPLLTEEQIDSAIKASNEPAFEVKGIGPDEQEDPETETETEDDSDDAPDENTEDDQEEPQKQRIPDEVRDLAKSMLDLDDEEVDALPGKVLAKMLKKAIPHAPEKPVAKPALNDPRDPEPEAEPAVDDDWSIELSEDLDEGLRNAILGLKDRFSKQLSVQSREIDRLKILEKQWQQQEVDRHTREIDSVFMGLSSDFSDLVGQGSADEMSRESAEFQNRLTILDNALALGNALESQGKPVPENEKLFRMAIQMAFPDFSQKQVTQKLSSDLRRQQKRLTQKPTGSRQKPQAAHGDEAALSFAAQFIKEHGLE